LEGCTDHPGNRRLIRAGSRTTRAPSDEHVSTSHNRPRRPL
jgi:hypothetical protein